MLSKISFMSHIKQNSPNLFIESDHISRYLRDIINSKELHTYIHYLDIQFCVCKCVHTYAIFVSHVGFRGLPKYFKKKKKKAISENFQFKKFRYILVFMSVSNEWKVHLGFYNFAVCFNLLFYHSLCYN